MHRFFLIMLCVAFGLVILPVLVAADAPTPFVIGYLEGDWGQAEEWNRHPADMGRLADYLPHRPFDGAEIGVDDAQWHDLDSRWNVSDGVRKRVPRRSAAAQCDSHGCNV